MMEEPSPSSLGVINDGVSIAFIFIKLFVRRSHSTGGR
jgi:hypothetical protein